MRPIMSAGATVAKRRQPSEEVAAPPAATPPLGDAPTPAFHHSRPQLGASFGPVIEGRARPPPRPDPSFCPARKIPAPTTDLRPHPADAGHRSRAPVTDLR
ncbi:hypothetical protein GCM10027610_108770 [Dactylosporangium cerinum]